MDAIAIRRLGYEEPERQIPVHRNFKIRTDTQRERAKGLIRSGELWGALRVVIAWKSESASVSSSVVEPTQARRPFPLDLPHFRTAAKCQKNNSSGKSFVGLGLARIQFLLAAELPPPTGRDPAYV
jgi:hypothetical protein